MKYIKTLGLIAVILIITSCEDEFLDVPPAFEINSESFFNSKAEYEKALIGAYDLLAATYVNVITAEIASDNALAGGESANDVPAWQEIDDMTHTPVNDQLRNVWNWMYAGISRANYIFEFQDKTDFEGKNQILAQTAFLRAYYYFELVKFFGAVPMPLDKRVNFGEESGFQRTPVNEVYDQIEADLRFAADNLPATQGELGRATSGAALALLGKAHLYQEEFGEAATVLEAVINANTYDLFSDYSTLFLQANENSVESIFEVQYSNNQGAGFGCLQCSEGNVMVGFNGIRGYEGPVYRSGFSFNIPTQELVDQFETGDLRLAPTILDLDLFISQQPQPDDIKFTEGFEHTGFYNHKYIPRQGEAFQDPNLTNLTNYRSIRFSDVLLMAGEALNRGGIDDGRALTYLNRVRARAGLAPVSVTGTGLTNAIYRERRVELAGEGHHFFDLVRTGRAADEIEGFQVGKHELFPIPLIEIELGGNVWEQNPQY